MQRITRFTILLMLCCFSWCGVLFANSTTDEADKLSKADYTVPSWNAMQEALAASRADDTNADLEKALKDAIAALQKKEMPYSIVMCINGDPKTQMAFNWFTNAGITEGQVEIKEGKDVTDFTGATVVKGLAGNISSIPYKQQGRQPIPGSEESYVSHKVLVKDLKAGTTYSFRVGYEDANGKYWSETGSFTTAKDDKGQTFSFIYYTDPQAMNAKYFSTSARTTHAAHQKYPDVSFWLNAGDLVESYTSSEWEYEQFFATQQDIWMHKPTAFVIGNHDCGKFAKNFEYHFNYARTSFDDLQSMKGSVYSFVWGDALFLAIQLEDFYGNPDYQQALLAWIREQVETHKDVKWKIPFFHRPVYTGSSHQDDGDAQEIRNALAPLFDELDIDFALQGHDHVYNVIGPVKGKQLVAGAAKNVLDLDLADQSAWGIGTPNDWNMTRKWKGEYDVTEGTLYFLNNSAGLKKYWPRGVESIHQDTHGNHWAYNAPWYMLTEAESGIKDYWSLFTGRFGQRGLPTFSHIEVSPESIKVSTFEVHEDGTPELFDEFTIVKPTNSTNTPGTTTVNVTGVKLDKTALSLEVGRSEKLTATVEPTDATNKKVTWVSADEKIATVDQLGNVKGIAAGKTTITVTTEEGAKTASCEVTVTAPAPGTTTQPTPVQSALLERVQVMPNPFSQHLTLKGVEKANEYILLNAQGMVMLQGALHGESQIQLDTHNLSAGIYILVLRAEDGAATLRVVKR